MAVWPVTLPQSPYRVGYSEAPIENVIKTQMEVGPVKVRRRSSARSINYHAQYHLTKAQVQTLDGFYRATLNDGSLAFDWPHPRLGTTVSVRFDAPPVYVSDSAEFWTVSCNLVQDP